jgi:hypothetical protein
VCGVCMCMCVWCMYVYVWCMYVYVCVVLCMGMCVWCMYVCVLIDSIHFLLLLSGIVLTLQLAATNLRLQFLTSKFLIILSSVSALYWKPQKSMRV